MGGDQAAAAEDRVTGPYQCPLPEVQGRTPYDRFWIIRIFRHSVMPLSMTAPSLTTSALLTAFML